MTTRVCSRCGLLEERHNITIGNNPGHALISSSFSDEEGIEILRFCMGFKSSSDPGSNTEERCPICDSLYSQVAHRCSGCGHDYHLHRFGPLARVCACGCINEHRDFSRPEPYIFPPSMEWMEWME